MIRHAVAKSLQCWRHKKIQVDQSLGLLRIGMPVSKSFRWNEINTENKVSVGASLPRDLLKDREA